MSRGLKWSKINKENHKNIIIVCTGPSLKDFDFNLLKDKGFIITVNGAGKYVPFADAWFTLDPWGLHSGQAPNNFSGELWAAVPEDYGTINSLNNSYRITPRKDVKYLHRIPFHTSNDITNYDYLEWGLNEDPSCINTGNSGFGALNMAYHMKPKNIFLFGLDASKGYFFSPTRVTKTLQHLPLIFKSAKKQLSDHDISIINASPNSNITCFPKYTLESAMERLG